MRKTKADENSVSLQEAIFYAEECQNNTVFQISGKILRMRKQLKPGVLSAIREHWVRGYII